VPHRWVAGEVGEIRSCSMEDWLICLMQLEADQAQSVPGSGRYFTEWMDRYWHAR
jgi:hypothetical protein